VRSFQPFYILRKQFTRLFLPIAGIQLILCFTSINTANAQECPPNIDFESGSFDRWNCFAGSVAAVGNDNVITLFPTGGPVGNVHTMFNVMSSGAVDPYGGFPINCPNGSGHSIKLGNDQGGGLAEGISYEFTIPAGRDIYNLIYHYAVVFQDPNHRENEQPRMEIEITNITDNTIIQCSSFSFRPYGTPLPGFQISPIIVDNTPIWYKDWSAVSINLNGHAGKTIRLFFKTADCTFRRHFGYAYIDVNSECSSEFVGATYCPDDTAVTVVAPYGYQAYTWWDAGFGNVIGTSQTIRFAPPPAAGTTIAVEVVPYNGYGCLDTLYAKLIDTLTISSNAGPNKLSCNNDPVQIGSPPKPGLVYSWDPPTGLSNPSAANPFANPSSSTNYILTTKSSGGGCVDTDTVLVDASVIDNSLQLIGKPLFCVDSDDSALLRVHPTDSIQWFRNETPITAANQTDYRVRQSGIYHAMLFDNVGCRIRTANQEIIIETPKPGITYPLEYALIELPLTLKARQFGVNASWSPGTWLDIPNSYTPVFKGSADQLYLIKITTAAGCVTIDTQFVKTIDKVEVFVPTGFSPNNDGKNDRLRPTLKGIKELRYFRIFNRGGQVVYDAKTPLPGWDGKFRGMPQSSQVFVWMLAGIGLDGKMYMQKGTCVLVR
jgi:gliding motility-associated-like protein